MGVYTSPKVYKLIVVDVHFRLWLMFFPRICSGLDKMTLSHDTDIQSDIQSSEDQSDQVAEPLKACVAPQYVYKQIVRINQQVLDQENTQTLGQQTHLPSSSEVT